jgi:SMI1-KNR4 cell-wall
MSMKNKITGKSEDLTDRKIKNAERQMGRSIPLAYRNFLLEHNGGHPDQSDFRMAGVRKGTTQIGTVKSFLGINLPEETLNLDYVLETFRDRVPTNLFPIARDPGGNLILIAENGFDAGKVYFWDHERESDEGEPPTDRNLYLIANSFDEFLDKLGEA